jgi:hypothetical protein
MGIFSGNSGSYNLTGHLDKSSYDSIPKGLTGSYPKIDPDPHEERQDDAEKSKLVFTKHTDKNLKEQIQLSKEEEKFYFEPAQKLCEAYFKSLTYFLSAEFHTDQKKPKMSAKEVQQFLVEIFLKIGGKDEIIRLLRKENISEKFRFSEKVAAKFYYPEYSDLNKKYAQVAIQQNFRYWYKSIDINYHLTKESQNKHFWDRIDYYLLTPSDSTLFNMFVVPVLGFHAVVFYIAIPPIGGVLATTQSFAILTGIGAAKTVVQEATKSVYNLVKTNKYFLADRKLSEARINKLTNLEALKLALADVKESTSRTGQFNYYFANAFKYYCELKENCEKFNKFCSSFFTDSAALDQKKYDKEIPKIRDLYYKTLYYSRSNKIIADTLRIQLEALKAFTFQSLYLLTSDPHMVGFFKARDICLSENMSKIMTSKASVRDANTRDIIYKYLKSKYNKVDHSLATQLTAFVLLTMSSKQVNLDEAIKNQIKVNENPSSYKKFKGYYDEFQHPADVARRGVYTLANLPFSQAYFAEINKYSYSINMGSWVAFSIFDVMLYASNSNFAKDKYAKIRSWCGNIVNGMYVGFHVIGAIDLFSKMTGLFSNSIISGLAFSPFGIFVDVGIINLAGQVSSNEAKIWKDIEEKFVKEKEKPKYNKGEKLWDPAYNYFTKDVALMPGDSIHKLGNMFKKRLTGIADLAVKINSDTIELVEGVKSFDTPSRGFFSNKVTEEQIIKKYTKTMMNLISLHKELEAYEYYMENVVKDINDEIDQALKFYLTLISVEHRSAFSITQFAKDEMVYKKFFSQEEKIL